MRRWSLACALVVLVALSGCTLPGGTLTAEAAPATVNERTLDETGYVTEERAAVGFNETLGIAGEDREVGIRNWIAAYANADGDGRLVVFSTPNPSADGEGLNPFANRSERRDVARMLGEVNNTTPLDVTRRRNVTMLGQSTEMVTYETTNRTASGQRPILVHVAVTRHRGDTVVTVGVHPRSVDEAATMRRLVESIDHGESA